VIESARLDFALRRVPKRTVFGAEGFLKTANCYQLLLPALLFLLHASMNLSRSREENDMAHYALVARINAGNGNFTL
jgi:hypothetical protein